MLIMFFINSVSPSIRSEQFLLTLSATEYGMFVVTFGGCDDSGLRYSCKSVNVEYISGIKNPFLRCTLVSRNTSSVSLCLSVNFFQKFPTLGSFKNPPNSLYAHLSIAVSVIIDNICMYCMQYFFLYGPTCK